MSNLYYTHTAKQYQNYYSKNKLIEVFLGLFFFTITIFSGIQNAGAQTLPTGFSQVLVANGLSNPTTMAFAPDGRIFIAQQTGQLRVIKNGILLSQPFVTVSTTSSGERGLNGIAFDPNFATNNYLYLFYTLSSGARNRVSRFTANGDVAVAGSEVVILDLDPLSSATNHNGGSMQFGPDGKLYIGTGENANTDWAQNLDSYHGKILRINSDGSVPTGNPYTSGSNQRQRVWSLGLRNPFTLSIQPGTGRLFVNDVGQVYWEEINEATTSGKNFGWAWEEGMGTNPAFTSPIYTYEHESTGGSGCAITGGTFFNPSTTNYPASYIGKYFYMDYCGDWINMLTLSGSTAASSGFATGISGSSVSIKTGTDGNLYFLSRDNGAVYKITYTGSSAPVITNQPQSISVAQGNQASFSVSATGGAPLSFQWKKSGTNISGATAATYTIASATSANAGTYSVVVSNSSGNATSNNATLTVTSPNQSPVATITAPVSGATYAAGEIINFTGTGTDPEDGTLAANVFNWYVIFYHSTHTHPGPSAPSGVKSGSFTIPNTGETAANVMYRLYLVVTDTQGAKDTTYTDILPRTSTITLNTNPQGLAVTLDGQPFTAPLSVTSVVGMLRTIGTTSPQTSGSTYNFSSWSQGGAQTQTFATPVNNISYTANFTAATNTNTPYGGTARLIPGTIQVEDYDNGGQNIAYYDVSPGNTGEAYRPAESVDLQNSTEGVANIGWTDPSEWTKYTVNVTTAGVYTLGARVSSQNANSSFRVEMDGVTIATIAVPNTGGYQSWQTVSKPDIYLTAGIKVMRIYFITGGFNINYLSFTSSTVSNYPPVANAGADISITLPANSTTLSGSGTDQDGTVTAYQWTKVSGPAASITTATSSSTTVTGLTQGVYTFELKVTDNNAATGTDIVQVTVNAATTTTGEKLINVNIYGINLYNNTQWNNWKPVTNTVSADFKYADGTVSTVNALLTKQKEISDNGANYASTATSCPPAVLQYYSASNETRSLQVNGLDPKKKYTFTFFASSTITPNGTTFLINGYGSDDVMTDNNINNVGKIINVSPNSSGAITVIMVSINTWNFIAGFTVLEQASSSRGTPELITVSEKAKDERSGNVYVFPNPFSGSVQVQINDKITGEYQLSLINIYGSPVWKKNITGTNSSVNETIETGNIPRGVYYLQVQYPDQKRSVYKLLKNY